MSEFGLDWVLPFIADASDVLSNAEGGDGTNSEAANGGGGENGEAEVPTSYTGLIVYITVALGVSFVCSVLEAVLLSTSASYLEVSIKEGRRGARRMRKHKENIDRAISAILTLNTIAHTVGATGVGAEAVKIWGDEWSGVIGGVLALLVLVASEIIPKTLGAVYWKPLVPMSAITIHWMVILLYPIVWACQWLTDFLKPKEAQPKVTRAEIEVLAHLGQKEGALAASEMRMFRNLLGLRDARVSDILTPRTVLFSLPESSTAQEAIDSQATMAFSRIPLTGSNHDDISTFVLRFEILEAIANGNGDTPLSELARKIHTIPDNTTVAEALNRFVDEGEHIFLVVDEYGGTDGILTLEDAIESLLGVEITDESDLVADLQDLAKKRAARIQRRLTSESPANPAEAKEPPSTES